MINTELYAHNEQVRCGGQFNAVLCDNGTVYTWGKGDHHRLGHGSEEHSPHPRVVEALLGKRVTDVAVGICHSAVCTEDNEIFAWGLNDHGQLGELNDPVVASPKPLRMRWQTLSSATPTPPIVGLTCGPNQVPKSKSTYRKKQKASPPSFGLVKSSPFGWSLPHLVLSSFVELKLANGSHI